MKFDLREAVAVLSRTPAVLIQSLHLSPAWTQADEGPDTWSAFDIVGHLVHGEREDWIPRARIILEHGESKTFEPFDRFAQFEESKGKTLEELLRTFADLRKQSLETLEGWNLTESDLNKKGTHPAFGPVTLRQLLSTWVVHDLGHIAQINRVMAKQLKEEIGPWQEYLPIVWDRK